MGNWQRMLVAGCCALLCITVANAHRDLHEQIAIVTRKIETAPTAELYLQRGELHRHHAEHDEALADFAAAEKLDPGLEAIRLARGQTLLEAGRAAEARGVLDAFLAKNPEAAHGYLARARALAKLGEPARAAADFDRAIVLFAEPQPEHFLERAEALAASGRHADALAGLNEGVKRLGGAITLQLAALDLELKLGRFDAALARVDGLIAKAARKEWWQERKGDILQQAGRTDQARAAYADALASLARLPIHLRATKAARELEDRLRSATAGAPGESSVPTIPQS